VTARLRSGCSLGTLLVAVTSAATASGDPAGERKATAETLFEEGRSLVEHGSYGEACPKFAESQRLEPGIGTMLWLADCLENDGQTASAWATFKEAASAAGTRRDPREQVARTRADALRPKLSQLAVSVPPSSAVEGLEVLRDGVPLGRAAWSLPLPVDPGSHSLVARAPGHRTWTVTLIVHPDASSLEIGVPQLDAEEPPAPVAGSGPAALTHENSAHEWSPWQTAGVIAAGVGIVGIGVGAVLSLAAKSRYDDSNQGGHCLPDDFCDSSGKQDRSEANGLALGATVAMAAGAAALAGGTVLYFTAPKSRMRWTVQPTPSGASLQAALRF